MTEAEWLTIGEFRPMLDLLKGNASPRKLRLFGVACCRAMPLLADDPEKRQVLEAVEVAADEVLGEVGAALAHPGEYPVRIFHDDLVIRSLAHEDPWEAAFLCADGLYRGLCFEEEPVCDLVREVFPNPFLQPKFDLDKVPSEVFDLAREMYISRDFTRLPLMAGRLYSSHWRAADLLKHCCAFRPHVRGCWAVDLVLSQE